MKLTRKILVGLVLTALSAPALTSCFTGVESTPKITARDVRKRHAQQTPEEAYMAGATGQPVSQWHPGKTWRVTDSRIGLVLQPLASGSYVTGLEDKDITLDSIGSFTSITGEREAQLYMHDPDGRHLVYRPGQRCDDFMARNVFSIPFTVEMSLVDEVRSLIAGNRYYILVARRIGPDSIERNGLRYVPVTILDVVPGTDTHPLRVIFRNSDGQTESLLMTVGNGRTSTRNFGTLFAFSDPRKLYPAITDRIWDLIQHSRVEEGMTSQECRLALGTPDDYTKVPSTAGMVELWKYNNGMYLRFDDGRLSGFRM